MEHTASQLTWWGRPGLEVRAGRLAIAGRDAESIAREHGTPLYVYDLAVIERQVAALRAAMPPVGELAYAVKANPALAIVAHLGRLGLGADVASAGEHTSIPTLSGAPGAPSALRGARKAGSR